MTVLDAAMPDGVDVVVDAGNIGASAIHHLPVRRDGRFIVALGMGGMGYSFGAGVGMAFAARASAERRTVVIAGDGSFFMHGMEIHTALQYRLPVTFLLFDNHAHAMCVTREQLFYDDLYSYNRFGPSRLGAGLATMFPGLPSMDVDDIDRTARRASDRVRGRWPVGGQRRMLGRRNPAVRSLSRQSRRQTTVHYRRRTTPMSLPALDDITAHRGTADPIDDVVRIETAPREKATPIIMEMMRSVYPHDEVFGEFCTVNAISTVRPTSCSTTWPTPAVSRSGRTACEDSRPTEEPGLWLAYDRLGSETADLHPHCRQPGRDDRRLPLRVGPGQAPLDDLPDADRRRAGGVRQAWFGRAVDQLPPPVLRQQSLSGSRAAEAAGLGRRLLGHVRRPAICWS